jgi:hypothetical protein
MKTVFKISLLVVIAFAACKKDTKTQEPTPTPTPTPASTGTLKINFENTVDTANLVFDTDYKNAKGETYRINKFMYYISNIVLTKTDNSTYVEPNSYYLVDASKPLSALISMANVPQASYKSISFMLGVDSMRNVNGAGTGALDQSNGMYWTWATGYIMLKLEGSSPASGAANKALTLHMGGFGGVNKAQRNFSFAFGSTTANVTSKISPLVHLTVDANKMFVGNDTLSFTTNYFQMSANANVKKYADNYDKMIEFEHVHND